MRAARLLRQGFDARLESTEMTDPVPGPSDVVVEVAACGVCRTDLQLTAGDLPARRLPVVPGHQAVGRIVAAGEQVADRMPGDRVGVAWLAGTCGACKFCMTGRENLCEQARFTGWDQDGGFAELMTAKAAFTYLLPDGRTDLEMAPLLCGGVIGYRALKVSGIEPGGRLGLYGFGASALLAIQVAVHWDCEVFVVTRSAEERHRALDLGAVWAGSYDDEPPASLDAAVTFAPVGSAVVAALGALDRGGIVAVNAIHLDRIPEFDYDLLWWERQIRSVANFTRADATEFLRLAAEIPIQTVVDPYCLHRVDEALAAVRTGTVTGAAVVVM